MTSAADVDLSISKSATFVKVTKMSELLDYIKSENAYCQRSEVRVRLLRLLQRNIDKPFHVFTWLWQYIHRGGTQATSVDIYERKATVNLQNSAITIQSDGLVLIHPHKRDANTSTWRDSIEWALAQDDSDLRNDPTWIPEITDLCRQYIRKDSLLLASESKFGYHLDASIADVTWLQRLLQQVDLLVGCYPDGFICRNGEITPHSADFSTGYPIEYVFYDGLVGWVIQVSTTVSVKDLLRIADIHPIDLIRNADVIDRTLEMCVRCKE